MPCRISNDAHERINHLPTVSTFHPVNLQSGERAGMRHWEEKTPQSFTAACSFFTVSHAESSWERRNMLSGMWSKIGTPTLINCIDNSLRRGHVQVGSLGGAPGQEKASWLPKGQLRRDRNPPESARAKAGLTGSPTGRDPDAKAWPSDPSLSLRGWWG